MKIPGIVIAASASGSGKTAVTMAMMKAFKNAGRRYAPANADRIILILCFTGKCWELIPRMPGFVFL